MKRIIILLAFAVLILDIAVQTAYGMTDTPVCTAPGSQLFPAISGDTIVWQDERNMATTGSDIYMWDPVHGERAVCTAPDIQITPAISGDTIVWQDERNMATTGSDIYMWDPVHGERAVCTAPRNQEDPAISGDTIVWADGRNIETTGSDIYMWDPVNGERAVCTAPYDQTSPAISGDTIVWQDGRNLDTTWYDIYMWDPVNGERAVCTAPGKQEEPAISGDTIVWADDRNGDTAGYDIYMWDPVNGEQAVYTAPNWQNRPAISGDTIVWQDYRNPDASFDLYMVDLKSDSTPPVTTASLSGTMGEDGWYVSDVTLTLSPTDDGSGVAETWYGYSCPPYFEAKYDGPVTFSYGRPYTVSYYSVDNAGNRENAGQVDTMKYVEFKIDKTAPDITITTPAESAVYTLGQGVVADYDLNDPTSVSWPPWPGSGVDTGTLQASAQDGQTIDTSTPGQHTFTVSVKDHAGNLATKTVHYQVGYHYYGPLSPLDGLKNKAFKAGQIIPVKFQLKDYKGNYVTTASAKLYIAPVKNGVVGGYTPAIPNNVKSGTEIKNNFKYDALTNTYVFQLTKSLPIGTYRLKTVLDDGTEHTTDITIV